MIPSFYRSFTGMMPTLSRSLKSARYVTYKPAGSKSTGFRANSRGASPFASTNSSSGKAPPEIKKEGITHQSLNDNPKQFDSVSSTQVNWSESFHGLGSKPFSEEIVNALLAPIITDDIEIKPDGLLYLPEIKYRRILNKAFGPGGWGLAPRTDTTITPKQISREYALICHGRLVSVARGEQDYFGGEEKIATALEGCKSNALMRCCKDLGIASELWDPSFIKKWKKTHCDEVFAEHVVTKKKRKLWKLKKNETLDYPYSIS